MAAIFLAAGLVGCRTPSIDSARRNFYAGRLERAEQRLQDLPSDSHRNKVLYLMERGAIRQSLFDLQASTRDWLDAVDLLEASEPYSVSRGAASLIVNDSTLAFRGFPYERTLLRTMLAFNFMLSGEWQSAAVEARNIIANLEDLNGFPDDAFSRYVAGFSLEMVNDREGAALQYRLADALLDDLQIDSRSGRWQMPEPGTEIESGPELIVFAMLSGLSPGIAPPAYVEFHHQGGYLGRSHQFSNTAALLSGSQQRIQALQTAKDVTRIAVKETIFQMLLRENEGLGMLAGVLLYSAEGPDTRRWETLPRSLQVARFRVPDTVGDIIVRYRDSGAAGRQTRAVTAIPGNRPGVYFLICRDFPPFPPD